METKRKYSWQKERQVGEVFNFCGDILQVVEVEEDCDGCRFDEIGCFGSFPCMKCERSDGKNVVFVLLQGDPHPAEEKKLDHQEGGFLMETNNDQGKSIRVAFFDVSFEQKEVMRQAIRTWGTEKQDKKTVEEMSELTKAICKDDEDNKIKLDRLNNWLNGPVIVTREVKHGI